MSGGLGGMSDADLMSALGQGASPPAAPDFSGLSDADLMRQLGQPMPAPAQAAASTRSWSDTAADVGRSVLSGLDAGVAGIAGFPADAARGISWAKDYADAKLSGRDQDALAAERDAKAPIPRGALEPWGSGAAHQGSPLNYKPETTGGQYAESVASFAPGALMGPGSLLRRFALGAGVPGLASEGAGELTSGTAAEPYARIAAALASPALASRAITPLGVPAARAPLVATLEREGVPLTAGQRTGSAPLQWMESTLAEAPFAGGGATRAMEAQRQGLNRAVARRFGEDADTLTPDVMDRAARRIGDTFEGVSSRNPLQFDAQMGQDIADTIARYGRKLPSQTREAFGNTVQDIRDQVIAGGGAIPGQTYQQARSDLTKIAQGARQSDPAYSSAMGGLRDALDGAFERSVAGTADAGALGQARREYANMKLAERALSGAGVTAAEGNVSPAGLRSAVAAQDRAAYVRGQGDTADLARAATAIEPLKNSGTNPRNMAHHALTVLGSAGAGMAMGVPNETALMAAAAGLMGPAVGGRVLMSPVAQRYLGNDIINAAGGGPIAPLLRAWQGYEDSQAAPLQLRGRRER